VGAATPRIEGGIKEGGSVAGISFPLTLPCIKWKATAKPSRVRRPSLLRSAKSLSIVVRLDSGKECDNEANQIAARSSSGSFD
jgi:hypothetical protein